MKKILLYVAVACFFAGMGIETISSISRYFDEQAVGCIDNTDGEEKAPDSENFGKKEQKSGFTDDFFSRLYLNNALLPNPYAYQSDHNKAASAGYIEVIFAPPENS